MFKKSLMRAWVGILFLSGMFLTGQDAWSPPITCPSGTYDDGFEIWALETTGGSVSGTVTHENCQGTWTVTGTSDGVNVALRVENPAAEPCCTSGEATLTANVDCSVLEGVLSFPPDSNCYPGEQPITLTKIALSRTHDVEAP